MRAVDTNVLVQLSARDDPKQVVAAETFVSRGAWVPQVAVVEATWVLVSVYELGREAIATAVEMLLNHEHLTIQNAATVAAAVEQFRRQSKVEFSDCLVEVDRQAGHLPLGTFDQDLTKIHGTQHLP